MKDGYKKTDLGWIPDDWQIKKMGSLYEFKNGVNASKERYGKGIKFINVMDIFNHSYLKHKDIIGSVSINQKQIENYLVCWGDVLFNRTSETPEDIATSAVYLDDEAAVFGGFVIKGSPTSDLLNPDFQAYLFRSGPVRKEIIRRGQGAVRTNIGQSDLAQVHLPVPTKEEQKKIAKILSSSDQKIQTLQKLIQAKKKHKKALMQKLLSGKKRFPEYKDEKWKKVRLGSVVSRVQRKVEKPSEDYLSIGIRSHGKGTFQKPEKDPEDNKMEYLYQVKEDDLIVNITFAWEGAIAIVKKEDDGGYVSHRFPTYEFNRDKLIPEYFRHAIVQPRFFYLLETISPGGAGRNRVLNKGDFLKLKIDLPGIEEQKKIGGILNKADKEIEILEEKLDTLKLQKKGLMQQLLTGKKRVTHLTEENA